MNIVSQDVSHKAYSFSLVENETAFAQGLEEQAANNADKTNSNREAHRDQVSLNQGKGDKAVYDKPQIKAQADKQNQEHELSEAEQKQVDELKKRDAEVRTHEQAHASVGGQYAGSPSYEYQTGPDGRKYAVGGEVSISVSEENDPKDTIQKMQVVRRAALAPAEPSAQDYKVAAEASRKEQSARADLQRQSSEELHSKDKDSSSQSEQKTDVNQVKIASYLHNQSASTQSAKSSSAQWLA